MLDDETPDKGKSKKHFDGLRLPKVYKPLEREEEFALGHAYFDDGNKRAGKKLHLAYTHLARRMARSFWRKYGSSKGESKDDFYSESDVALARALEKYDPHKGVKFGTYAGWWIQAQLQDYVMRNYSHVRMGSTAAQKTIFFNYRRLAYHIDRSEDTVKAEDKVTIMAELLGVPESDIRAMQGRLQGDFSLNAQQKNDDQESREWIDTLEDPDADHVAEILKRQEAGTRREMLLEAMEKLNDREKDIFTQRRLIDKPVTLEALGEIYDLSKERVRQLEVGAFQKVQKNILGQAVDKGLVAPVEMQRIIKAETYKPERKPPKRMAKRKTP